MPSNNDALVIWEQPNMIFDSPADNEIRSRLVDMVFRHLVLASPLPASLRNRLAWYPGTVANMVANKLLSAEDRKAILAEPQVACSALLHNYDALAPLLEPALRSHPASVRRILKDRRFCGRQPLLPDSEYMALLANDPFRYFDMIQDTAERAKLGADYSVKSEACAGDSASWAFVFLATHSVTEVPDKVARALADDQEMVIRAIHWLKVHRRMSEAAWLPLVKLITAPQWAFHALVHGLCTPSTEAALLDILHSCPPWLVEYWHAAKITQDALRESYLVAAKRACAHPCSTELHYCYRMARFSVALTAA